MIFKNRWSRIGLVVVCVMLMAFNTVGVSLANGDNLRRDVQTVEAGYTFNVTDSHDISVNNSDIVDELNLDKIQGQPVQDYEFDYANIDSTPNDVKFEVDDVDTGFDFDVDNGDNRSFPINKSDSPYSYEADEIEYYQEVSSINISMIDDFHLTNTDDFTDNASNYDGVEITDNAIKQMSGGSEGNYMSNWIMSDSGLNGTLDDINYNSTPEVDFYIQLNDTSHDWISYENISYDISFEQIRFKLIFNTVLTLDVNSADTFDYDYDFQRTLKPPSDSTYDNNLNKINTVDFYGDNVKDGGFSSDGEYYAVALRSYGVVFYETDGWTDVREIGIYKYMSSVSWTPDGDWCIVGGGGWSQDGYGMGIIDTSSSDPSDWHRETYFGNQNKQDAQVSPSGDYMALAERDSIGFTCWDITDSSPSNWNVVYDDGGSFSGDMERPRWSSDGDYVSVTHANNGLIIYDTSDSNPSNWGRETTLSTSDNLGVSTWINTIGGNDTYLYAPMRSTSSFMKYNTSDWTSEEVTALDDTSYTSAVSPNGDYYFVGGDDNVVYSYYIANGAVGFADNLGMCADGDSGHSHSDDINSIEFTDNGEYMVTGSYDGDIIIWDTSEFTSNEYGDDITMRKSEYTEDGSGFIAEYGIMDDNNYYGTWRDRHDLNDSRVGLINFYDVEIVGDDVYHNFSWGVRGTTFDYASMNGDDYIIVGGADLDKLNVYDENGNNVFDIDFTWGVSVYSIDARFDDGDNEIYGHYSSIRDGTDRYWGDFSIEDDNTTSATSNMVASNTDRFYVDVSNDKDFAWVNLDSSELYINDLTPINYDTTDFTSIQKPIDWKHDSFQPNLLVAYKDSSDNIGIREYNDLGYVDSFHQLDTSDLNDGSYSNITYVKSLFVDDSMLLVGLHDWNGGDERTCYAIVETGGYSVIGELSVDYDDFVSDDMDMFEDISVSKETSLMSLPHAGHGDDHTEIFDMSSLSDVSVGEFLDTDILFTPFSKYNFDDSISPSFFFDKSVGFNSSDTLNNFGDEIIFDSIIGEFGYEFFLNYTYPEFRNSNSEGLITHFSATNDSVGDISNYTFESIKGDKVRTKYSGDFSELDGFSYSINQTGLVGANTYADFSSSVNLTYYFNVYYESPATGMFNVVTDYGFWGLFIPFVFAVGVGVTTRNDNVAGFTFTFILGIMFLMGWTPAIVMFITILAFAIFMTFKVHRWK